MEFDYTHMFIWDLLNIIQEDEPSTLDSLTQYEEIRNGNAEQLHKCLWYLIDHQFIKTMNADWLLENNVFELTLKGRKLMEIIQNKSLYIRCVKTLQEVTGKRYINLELVKRLMEEKTIQDALKELKNE